MLRDKWKDAFDLKKIVYSVKVNVSNHLESKASCQLPVLLLVIFTFILNIYILAHDQDYYISERLARNK